MAKGNKAVEAGGGDGAGGFDWKSVLVRAPVTPHIVALTPAQGSPVVARQVAAKSDVYLSISVLSFYHPEARRGLTRQVPLIFADATWRRPTETDLPQLKVMGPNPEAHPNIKSHGNYAFGGRTFFGPERFDGSVDLNIGLHLFKDNQAGRKVIDLARAGSKLLPKGEMLILGAALDGVIDGGLKALKALLPDKETPWIVGVIRSLTPIGDEAFETGSWAVIAGGGSEPGELYLDRHDNLLRDTKGRPLQRPYIVYSIDATDTNPDRLRIGNIPKARERLRQAHLSAQDVSDKKLGDLFRHFCQEVELSDELTVRDRDEIIAEAKLKFDRMMAQRQAFRFDDDPALYPSKDVSPSAISAVRSELDGARVASETVQTINAALEALSRPDDEAGEDDGMAELVRELSTAVSDFAALVRSNPEPYREQARIVAKTLRDGWEMKTLLELATAVRAGGVEHGWLSYFGAAADIELNGVPSLEALARVARGDVAPPMVAEAFLAKAIDLAGADYENDPKLLSDCLGLQGRIWKHRAVRAREVNDAARAAFERSYQHYLQGMAIGADAQFHQVNLLGLMNAAERRGIPLGRKSDAVKWAREILKQIKKGGADTDWKLANAGDAALFLGRDAEAAEFYTLYLQEAKNKPFAVNTTRRQLIEVWGIDPKGNTELSQIVRTMGQLSMRSLATVSMTVEEIEAMAETAETGDEKLEALLGGPPAIPARQIRQVLQLAQNVGKVTAQNGRAIGTGFLLHGKYLHPALANEYVFLTNDHVVCDAKTYRGSISSSEACILFEDLNPGEVYSVSEVFWRSDARVHDCAILRLQRQPEGVQHELTLQDSLPLRHQTETGQADRANPSTAPRVFIIGHPSGRGLEITFEQNFLIDHELRNSAAKATPQPVRIHYRAPTEPGNSGSPVLSANSLQLVGIHHKTTKEPLLPRRLKPNETYEANEGMWIQAIIAAVRAEKGDATPARPGGGNGAIPAPVVQPAVAAAPATVSLAPAGRFESLAEGDDAFFENMDGRLDTAQADYEGMGPAALESGASAVAAFAALSPKPKARWAALADHPDTKHLAHLAINLNNGMQFDVSGAILRQALAVAAMPVGASWSRRVLFGVRGASVKPEPKTGAAPEFADTLKLIEAEPDHLDYRCVMGVWDRDTDRVWMCPASTVPAIGYLWHATHERDAARMGMGANLLPPGVYEHVVGTHANGGNTRQPGAFRQKSKYCVMRLASPELCFRSGNIRWDTTSDAAGPNIWNNIHAGLVAGPNWGAKHFSAGCQVVQGTVKPPDQRDTPVGHWETFRIAAGLAPKPEVSPVPGGGNPRVVKTAEDGQAFTYVLLTAREVRLAAENMDREPTDLKFFKLRRGSQGDTVKALQTALGLQADGDFGYLTQRALIEKQLKLGLEADGVVTSANAAALGIT